jgi:hypothetical protein
MACLDFRFRGQFGCKVQREGFGAKHQFGLKLAEIRYN